jgi:hypothetical protein
MWVSVSGCSAMTARQPSLHSNGALTMEPIESRLEPYTLIVIVYLRVRYYRRYPQDIVLRVCQKDRPAPGSFQVLGRETHSHRNRTQLQRKNAKRSFKFSPRRAGFGQVACDPDRNGIGRNLATLIRVSSPGPRSCNRVW